MAEQRNNSLLQEQVQRNQRDQLLPHNRGMSPQPGSKQKFIEESVNTSSGDVSDDESTADGNGSETDEDDN